MRALVLGQEPALERAAVQQAQVLLLALFFFWIPRVFWARVFSLDAVWCERLAFLF